jgi:hypothetical protein
MPTLLGPCTRLYSIGRTTGRPTKRSLYRGLRLVGKGIPRIGSLRLAPTKVQRRAKTRWSFHIWLFYWLLSPTLNSNSFRQIPCNYKRYTRIFLGRYARRFLGRYVRRRIPLKPALPPPACSRLYSKMSSNSTYAPSHPLDFFDDHRSLLNVVSLVLAVITILIVLTRLGTRWAVSQAVGLDDGLIVISTVGQHAIPIRRHA